VRLAELLRELDKIDGLDWIRILYAYPIHFTDELIETLATAKKIVPYLDMPLQHINDRVLKRMPAPGEPRDDGGFAGPSAPRLAAADVADDVHRRLPRRDGGGVSGTERFRSVAAQRFERAGVFPYSFETRHARTRLDEHLAEEVKAERRKPTHGGAAADRAGLGEVAGRQDH